MVKGLSPWDRLSLTEYITAFSIAFRKEREADRQKYGELAREIIWLHVIEEISELAEALREMNLGLIYQNIASAFSWFCVFINELRQTEDNFIKVILDTINKAIGRVSSEGDKNIKVTILQKVERYYADVMVFLKYPGCCPLCGRTEFCNCLGMLESECERAKGEVDTLVERKIKHMFRREQDLRVPLSLYEWQEMFAKIYGRLDRILSIDQIAFHLMEETGEVARALRYLREHNSTETERVAKIRELQKELADMFDWLIALLIKLNFLLGKEATLGDAISRTFGNRLSDAIKTLIQHYEMKSEEKRGGKA